MKRREEITVKELSKALYDIDPMNTGCKENDLFDEYDHEAIEITVMLETTSTPTAEIFKEVFDHYFGSEISDDDIRKISGLLMFEI